ncbi:AMP-dependent synthetase/ligase [Corynebacterium terpenotabidum]|uniref:Acyl-CoA synthetase n=1 Tax=Corynebacterium terpenotabidum Y-11 TaxID=1200352 RepID=S4XHW2_9CORY|nr:long-chain fatty acid--CoA ligase [Corynebacterium terpenotabidum]AGP31275.1 acyl-CoA synthetase [Corynebacterium terpenotabidum Y-11]
MTTAPATRPTTVPLDPEVRSVGHMLRRRVAATPDRRAFSFPLPNGSWDVITWEQLGIRAAEIGAGLISLGVTPGQRVAIASSTRIEWVLANYGIMDASAATVTVYPTTIAEDVRFILDDSDSTVVFVEDADQLAKITALRDELPKVTHVVLMAGDLPSGADTSWILTFDALRHRGVELLRESPAVIDQRVDSTRLEHLATLIYTSGTTGRPKGVRLPHRVWVFEAFAAEVTVNECAEPLLTIDDKQFLWLPLAHVMGKLFLVFPLHFGFETAVDGRIDKIVENLAVVKPTFMASAPRIFEKAYNGVEATMVATGGITEKLYRSAVKNCGKVFDADNGVGHAGPWTRMMARVGDKLVMSKIRQRFGGNARWFLSGSAALNPKIARWFGAVGMPVLEGYGLTESSAGSCLTTPETYRTGYVGRPLAGMEVRTADDGEILLRGPAIMDGYHNNPEATAEVLTADGWFHTGDIGEIDELGRVRITDRKKELFKTSNGKYVAPALIESTFKGLCPLVSQMMVVGNGRKYASALVTLDEDAATAWAEKAGLSGTYREIIDTPQVHGVMQGYIDELNEGLNRWEQIKTFTILDRDLTVEQQEITPSLKLRRKVVAQHFADQVEAMYPEE